MVGSITRNFDDSGATHSEETLHTVDGVEVSDEQQLSLISLAFGSEPRPLRLNAVRPHYADQHANEHAGNSEQSGFQPHVPSSTGDYEPASLPR
jgi:hypothetical protein